MPTRILPPHLAAAGKTLLRVAIPLLLAAAALAWFVGTPTALRWAAHYAANTSTGRLAVEGLHGSLYGPLRIETLRYSSDETRVDMKEIRLDWSLSALFHRHIQISELAVVELRISEIKPSATPLLLPESLRLPVSLAIPNLTIQRLVLGQGEAQQVLSGLALALAKPADIYHLTLSTVTTPWGNGEVDATLSDAPPYLVSSRASLIQQGAWPYRVDATLAGTLARLALKATASSRDGRIGADALLTPFDPRLLAEMRIDASAIDPATLGEDLPQAEISARVILRSQGSRAYDGEITLQNTRPGAWDQARLPLRHFSANFAGTPEQLQLRDIRMELERAGSFSGSGQFAGKHLSLALATRDFDPRGIHSRLRSLKLAGHINVEGDAQSQQLRAELRERGYRLRLAATRRHDTVEIGEAVLESPGGKLSLTGMLSLAEARGFKVAGALESFDPAAFGAYPTARINATLSGTGHLAPSPEAALRFTIANSQLRGQPLSGLGNLNLAAQRIWDSAVLLRLAQNQVEMKGDFGAPADRLTFKLAADNLAALDPELAGQIHASATLTGSLAAPSGEVEVDARALRWRHDYRLASLQASARLAPGQAGELRINAATTGLATPQLKLDHASVAGEGRRDQQRLHIAARNRDFDLDGDFSGGWREGKGWLGQMLKLVNRGRHPFVLKAPAQLAVAPAHLAVANARFDSVGASLNIEEASYQNGRLTSRGDFQHLPASALLNLAAPPSELKGDLSLDGNWRLAMAERLDGHLAVWREQGDLIMPSVPPRALGLQRLALNLDVLDNQVQGRLAASGEVLGNISGELRSAFSRRADAWGLTSDAPLQASAEFSLPSVAWAGPLIDPSGGLLLDGAISGKLGGSGSIGQPHFTGSITGTRIKVELPELGLHFRDGGFLVELHDQTLQLKHWSLRGGAGSLTGQGQLALQAGIPALRLSIQAERLEVLARPDRHLILSGTGEVTLAEKSLRLSAKLKADRGLIELPDGDAPSPSTDVVVLGRPSAAPATGKNLPYALRLDLDLDPGEHFFLKWQGLDAQLGGALKVLSVNGALPRFSGSIRVLSGVYAAYGQRLEIERGILAFHGPLDDPFLDIVALRKNQEVEAGVAITGSALAPRVKLVSNPSVPDNEKLSWLVLGHGMDTSRGADFSVLQAAAGALLGAGEAVTLQSRIAHAAGLDEIGLKGADSLQGTMLTLGKRISSRTYLSYEYALTGAGTLVKINHALTRRLSVRVQAASAPAVDLFYTFSFD